MTLSGWLTFGLAVMALLAWYATIFVGYRKDTIRASEQDIVLNAFIQKQNSNEDLLAKAMAVLAAQTTLLIVTDETGEVKVRAVEPAHRDLLQAIIDSASPNKE